ncbi:MAG: orotidine-5'-phosphate decarboxylase [Candidatus Margulisiibacteriota bacterium]
MCKLVIGIDPDILKLPNCYKQNNQVDIYQWAYDVLDVCRPHAVAVKFQSAYFESYGLYGLSCLAKLIKNSKEMGYKVIMDAKRGDIGSTSKAYAKAYLAPVNDFGSNEFESDFLTVNPLMGEDAIEPFLDVALKYDKGVFLLLETSNPGASMILKESTITNQPVNMKIAAFIQKIHQGLGLSRDQFGPLGCVIGATNEDCSHWREKLPNSLFLMPGIGAQGGRISVVQSCITQSGEGVWVPVSRGITAVNLESLNRDDYLSAVRIEAKKIADELNKK